MQYPAVDMAAALFPRPVCDILCDVRPWAGGICSPSDHLGFAARVLASGIHAEGGFALLGGRGARSGDNRRSEYDNTFGRHMADAASADAVFFDYRGSGICRRCQPK